MRRMAIAVGVLLGAAMTMIDARAARSAGAQKSASAEAVNLCSSCHGPRGISTSPEFPTLAAQRETYLIAQLKAFRDRTRADKEAREFMWGIAAQLDDPTIEEIARYYATQPAPPGRPAVSTMTTQGRDLFQRGAPDRGIPACATCHGQDAEGSAEQPRLAGQHAKYVDKQLRYMQTQERRTAVMRGTVDALTSAERQAIATYVQSR